MQAEFVAGDGAPLRHRNRGIRWAGSRGETSGIEPVFEGCHRAVVLERCAVPDAFQRGDFVVAGSLASLQCVARVSADPVPGDQLVVSVKRRSVAFGAAFVFEDASPLGSFAPRWIWVRRRPEGVDVVRESVELRVAIAGAAGLGRVSSGP